MAPPQVVRWINQNYARPRVDEEWLNACCAWIAEELHLNPATQTAEFISNVENQLLESDLRDSMVEGTGLPSNIASQNGTRLGGPPVLVEITAITEIGHSAFNLQNVRQARIERADLAGLAAEEGVEDDEGPVPNYPRTMLRLEISDGTVTLPAIEYRPLSQLKIGETPLGYKIVLKDVLVRRGIVFLEPDRIILKGHRTEDRDTKQDSDFLRGLRRRLGKPDPPEPEDDNTQGPTGALEPPESLLAPAILQPANVGRLPLREISEPPEPSDGRHDDDGLPRRRRIPDSSIPQSSSTLVESRFFSSTSRSSDSAGDSTQNNSTIRQISRVLSPARADYIGISSSTESADGGAQQLRSKSANPLSTGMADDLEYDFGSEGDIDLAFLDEIERAEKEAMKEPSRQDREMQRRPGQASSRPRPQAPAPKYEDIEVITIDDDEDDKENVPVYGRRVRRRISTPPDDVIDLSD